MSLIACTDASRTFGAGRAIRSALEPCSFTVHAGEIVGVVGPNGAGKTTLLRLLAGESPPSTGSVLIAGFRSGTAEARRAVGFAPDPPLAPPELTGVEWLTYLASHRSATASQRVARVRWAIEFAHLADFAGRRIGQFSRGMAQRLGLAAAALLGASVLLLDEAFSGIDALVARALRTSVAGFAASGRAVMLASHDLATVERLATRVLVLHRGRLISDVSTARLLRERVAEVALNGGGLGRADWLLARFPHARRTGDGVAIPLVRGLTIEEILAACRDERIPVAASRVRYRALEDLLIAAAEEC